MSFELPSMLVLSIRGIMSIDKNESKKIIVLHREKSNSAYSLKKKHTFPVPVGDSRTACVLPSIACMIFDM